MVSSKIVRVSEGLGVILPKEALAELNVREGDAVIVSRAPTAPAHSDPKVAEQLEAGRAFARDYAETLGELAK